MISKKDQDVSNTHKMLEDKQSISMKLQKTLKELQQSVEMREEELQSERQTRCNAEKQCGSLAWETQISM